MRGRAWLLVAGMVAAMLFASSERVDAQVQRPSADPPLTRAPHERHETVPPVRLARIVRGLQRQGAGLTGGALRIDLELFVVGEAPSAVLLDDGDLAIGAPVYGGATHDEMLTVVTPPQLRSTAPYRRLRPSLPLDR